ncbi:hypothetical protein [Saccharopolyspora sp. 5N708]|uniref:hypothetical protein n=1 Tax=Saccharopolyspora sp. 5N708 TaxID=3457424 RepID=UPI003FD68F62
MVRDGQPVDRSWRRFWLLDGTVGLVGIGYVTAKIVLYPEQVSTSDAVFNYGLCIAAVVVFALCYWGLRQSSRERARGKR